MEPVNGIHWEVYAVMGGWKADLVDRSRQVASVRASGRWLLGWRMQLRVWRYVHRERRP